MRFVTDDAVWCVTLGVHVVCDRCRCSDEDTHERVNQRRAAGHGRQVHHTRTRRSGTEGKVHTCLLGPRDVMAICHDRSRKCCESIEYNYMCIFDNMS